MTSKIKDTPFHKVRAKLNELGVAGNTNVSVFINASKATTDDIDNHVVNRGSDNRYQRAIRTLGELFNADADHNINVYSVGSNNDAVHGGASFLGTCKDVNEILMVYDQIDPDAGMADCLMSAVTNKAIQMYQASNQYQVVVFLSSGEFNHSYRVNDMCQVNRASQYPVTFTTVAVDQSTNYLSGLDNHKKKDLDLDKHQKKEYSDKMKNKDFKLLIDNFNACDLQDDVLEGQDPNSPDVHHRLYHQVMMEVPKHFKYWRDKQGFKSSRNADVFIEKADKYVMDDAILPFRYTLDRYEKHGRTIYEFVFHDKDAPKYPVKPSDLGLSVAKNVPVAIHTNFNNMHVSSSQSSTVPPTYSQPVQPTYQQPTYQQPTYGNPQQPTYGNPQQPTYGNPHQQSTYGNPQQPTYGNPHQQSTYGNPQQPTYQQSTYGNPQQQPAYGNPQQQPAYGNPQQQPAYGNPQQHLTYGNPQQPAYGNPQYPTTQSNYNPSGYAPKPPGY